MDVPRELIGGLERRTITVVAYDSGWPDRYEQQRLRIAGALGSRADRIDHVGSTAVPGLAAKPIVDIDVSVEDPDDEPSFVPALEAAGYALRVREPGHRMLRSSALDVHVHVCATGSDWERRHLLFRDWLRVSEADRDRYAAAKKALASGEWPTMNDYADAKRAVIAEIMGRAEQWAAQSAWSPAG
ncbi:MAG: GrpB family protein [Actinomycetota bacterium]|nr:GrpB family protein [Actinomycetota bacterium]